MLTDWLKHKRFKEQRVQDILLGDRLAAYKELAKMLFEVWSDVPLMRDGLEPLRWPKRKNISPDFFDHAGHPNMEVEGPRNLAIRTHERFERLKKFVHGNLLVLAPSVQVEFWNSYFEFNWWRIRLQRKSDHEMEPHWESIEKAFDSLRRKPCEAMIEDLRTPAFDLIDFDEVHRLRETIGQRLSAASRKEEANWKAT